MVYITWNFSVSHIGDGKSVFIRGVMLHGEEIPSVERFNADESTGAGRDDILLVIADGVGLNVTDFCLITEPYTKVLHITGW